MSFSTAGRIQTVAVVVGEAVEAGTLLVVQEDAAAKANVAQAQARLFQAQAQMAELTAGPLEQEIAAAQAQVDAAAAQLAQLSEPTRPEDIAAAQADLVAAQAASNQLFDGPREEERIAALATLSNAEAAVQQAQSAYNQIRWRNDVGATLESRQLQEATNNLEAAQARYDVLFAEPEADLAAAARAGIQQSTGGAGSAVEAGVGERDCRGRGAGTGCPGQPGAVDGRCTR